MNTAERPDTDLVDWIAVLVERATGVAARRISVEPRAGHASVRRYWRARWDGGDAPSSALVMVLPSGMPPEEIGKGGPTGPAPFVDVQRYLAGIGVRVPHIFDWSQEEGFVVLEDLGDEMMVSRLAAGDAREPLYLAAVDLLARMRVASDAAPDPGCIAFQRRYDHDVYRWELEHFLEWGVAAWKGAVLSGPERRLVDRCFDELARRLAGEPAGFTHRDYQSRNIMVLRGGEQALIDFQDALLGPRQYDLVSLLRDSYVILDQDLIDRMVGRYLAATAAAGGSEIVAGEFREVFDLLTIQRKLKDAGRFIYIDRVKSNPSFLRFVPVALGYVREAFGRLPAMADLQAVLSRYVPELGPGESQGTWPPGVTQA
ncbi:MAG TPA: phosphotransferase [Actinomycetota bacterium]